MLVPVLRLPHTTYLRFRCFLAEGLELRLIYYGVQQTRFECRSILELQKLS